MLNISEDYKMHYNFREKNPDVLESRKSRSLYVQVMCQN